MEKTKQKPAKTEDQNLETTKPERAKTEKYKPAKSKPAKLQNGNKSQKSDVRADRRSRKEQKQREERMKSLENEVKKLRGLQKSSASERTDTERRAASYSKMEEGQSYSDNQDSYGEKLGDMVAKGAAGAIVLTSRLMQLASSLLMACLVLIMLHSFWIHGPGTGDIRLMAEEHNYGLAFYVGRCRNCPFYGSSLVFLDSVQKGCGRWNQVKKVRYRPGISAFPDVHCCDSGDCLSFHEVSGQFRGVVWKQRRRKAALDAVNSQYELLLPVCIGGAGAFRG